MSQENRQSAEAPWQQQLYDSIWLLAGAAILYWVLTYVVWGLVDLMSVPAG